MAYENNIPPERERGSRARASLVATDPLVVRGVAGASKYSRNIFLGRSPLLVVSWLLFSSRKENENVGEVVNFPIFFSLASALEPAESGGRSFVGLHFRFYWIRSV